VVAGSVFPLPALTEGHEIRKEDDEIPAEFGAVCDEFIETALQGIVPLQPEGNARERPRDEFIVMIRLDRSRGRHSACQGLRRERQYLVIVVQHGEHGIAETGDFIVVVMLPVPCQEMIVDHVDHDRAVTPEFGREPVDTPARHGMPVGVGIDRAMQANAALYGCRELAAKPALDEVAQETADDQVRVGMGHLEVGQVIHDAGVKAATRDIPRCIVRGSDRMRSYRRLPAPFARPGTGERVP